LHATLNGRHAALSTSPKAVSAGDCAPGLALLALTEFHPLDWLISFTPTEPRADDDVHSLVQRPGQTSPVLGGFDITATLAFAHFSLTQAAPTICP
jgi:hypothetical protein